MDMGSLRGTIPTGRWLRNLRGSKSQRRAGGPSRFSGFPHLVAGSPQAKGRIARLEDTLQDRLVAELRLAGITTLAAGDIFLTTTFLPAFTVQFAVPVALAASASRRVPRGWGHDYRCAFHYARRVAANNTVRVDAVVLQLLPVRRPPPK
jgi:hypothetical protein